MSVMRKTLISMLLAGAVVGCSGQKRTGAQKDEPVALPAGAIASIDGRTITREQVLDPLVEAHGLNVLLSLSQLEVARKAVADQKMTVTDADIQNEWLLTQKKMFGPDAQPSDYPELLEQFLRQQHLTRAEFDILIRTNAHLRKLAQQAMVGKVTDEVLREAFNAWYGETLVVRHIQCANIGEINEARRRMTAGESFENVAKLMSRNPKTSQLGGELPAFSRATTDMPPSFKDAAFALKEGEISDPVHAAESYHLIKLERRIAPKTQKFEDLKDSVRERYEDQFLQTQMNAIRASISKHVAQTLDIRDPVLREQFLKKMTQGQNEIRDQQKIREQLEREHAAAATQPTTANATKPAGEPPATAASPTTAPATDPTRP